MKTFPWYFTWHVDDFERIPDPVPGEILVADSWRVRHGTTWGIQDHLQRFHTGLVQQSPRGADLQDDVAAPAFSAAIERKLSEASVVHPGVELFPRISVEPSGASWRIVLAIRAAPAPRRTTSLWIPDYTDPRIRPTVKGPDIYLMRGLVDEAPTDDVVLHDGTNVHETTTGALLVWQTPEHLVLCGATQQLASISAQRIANHARSHNILVTTRSVTIQQLASGEYPVWFTNTLHGISPVSTVGSVAGEAHVVAHPAAAQWQATWWDMFAV